MQGKYYDLTDKDNKLLGLSIKKKDNFNCQLVDGNGEEYDGFLLAKSRSSSVFTICDFQKSASDQKYQARLVFRKTDEDFKDRNVNKGSDSVRIPFEKGQDGYREFWRMISFFIKWRKVIDLGEFEDYFAITDKALAEFLPKVASIENRDIVLKSLRSMSVEDLENIDNLIDITHLTNLINKWNDNKDNESEDFWQNLFQDYPWVLSQIFACPYLQIGQKTYCGGKEDDNKGGVEGDFLYQNELSGNITFIEIKTPKKDIIGSKYRGEEEKENVIFSIKPEVTGGVNQVLNQRNIYSMTHGEKGEKKLNNVKCVLIIGTMPDGDQKKSFELYRNSLSNVEVITFDELFKKIESLLRVFQKN